MKKILLALCAVSMLTMIACKKDTDNNNPNGGGNSTEQEEYIGEGYYMPTIKISHISENGTAKERWDWNDGLLESIDTADANGDYTPQSFFAYSNKRLTQTTTELMGIEAVVDYNYNSTLMKSFSATSNGVQMLSANLVRNTNNKISSIDLDLNDEMVQMIMQMLIDQFMSGNNGDDDTPDELSGLTTSNGLVRILSSGKGNKFSYEGASFAINIDWTGDNATRLLLSGTINLTVTVEEMRNIMSLDTSLATYSDMLGMLGNNTELPVAISVNDTINYTYDNHPNPYLGFFGALSVSAISANNMENTSSHGSMSADVTIPVPFFGDQHIPFSRALPERIKSNSYTYYENGYPKTITDQDGNIKQITYIE